MDLLFEYLGGNPPNHPIHRARIRTKITEVQRALQSLDVSDGEIAVILYVLATQHGRTASMQWQGAINILMNLFHLDRAMVAEGLGAVLKGGKEDDATSTFCGGMVLIAARRALHAAAIPENETFFRELANELAKMGYPQDCDGGCRTVAQGGERDLMHQDKVH